MTTPTQAEIVIIGGGIIGCSIAYHLTRMGNRDVLMLEKSGVTHGATWHAAGLVGQLRTSRNVTRMLQRSVELYDRLEAGDRPGHRLEEGGQPAPGQLAGAAAGDQARRHDGQELRAGDGASFGAKEAQDALPILMSIEDVLAAAFCRATAMSTRRA